MEDKGYAGLFLRLGLAFLFFYFGFDKLTSIDSSILTFEGLWIMSIFPFSVKAAVVMSGVIELLVGSLLLLGLFTKVVAIFSAVWTLLIFTLLGYPAAVYDIGLAVISLALYFTGPGKWSLKHSFIKQD